MECYTGGLPPQLRKPYPIADRWALDVIIEVIGADKKHHWVNYNDVPEGDVRLFVGQVLAGYLSQIMVTRRLVPGNQPAEGEAATK